MKYSTKLSPGRYWIGDPLSVLYETDIKSFFDLYIKGLIKSTHIFPCRYGIQETTNGIQVSAWSENIGVIPDIEWRKAPEPNSLGIIVSYDYPISIQFENGKLSVGSFIFNSIL